MPHFIPRKIHLRKSSSKSGHEISVPPDWVKYHDLHDKDKQELELLYDSIIIVSPPGTKLSKKTLKKISIMVEKENEGKESI